MQHDDHHTAPPVSDKQKAYLASLIRQGDVSVDDLLDAGYPTMTQAQLSVWLQNNSRITRERENSVISALESAVAEGLAVREKWEAAQNAPAPERELVLADEAKLEDDAA